MNFIRRIKCEKRFLISGYALVAAGIGLVLALISVIACGNFYLYSLLYLPRHSPPQLLFYFLFLLLSVLSCYICGMMSTYRGNDRCRLNGAIFLALSTVFLLLWYIAFFKTLSFVFALFLLISAFLLLLLAAKELWSVGILPVIGAGVAALLHLWFLWFTVAVILLN